MTLLALIIATTALIISLGLIFLQVRQASPLSGGDEIFHGAWFNIITRCTRTHLEIRLIKKPDGDEYIFTIPCNRWDIERFLDFWRNMLPIAIPPGTPPHTVPPSGHHYGTASDKGTELFEFEKIPEHSEIYDLKLKFSHRRGDGSGTYTFTVEEPIYYITALVIAMKLREAFQDCCEDLEVNWSKYP